MSDVCVVIPWRAMPARKWAYREVTSFYHKHFPDYPVYSVDTNDTYFNLAAARNFGMEYARQQGHTVVILTDADTIPIPANIAKAVSLAQEAPGVVLPYTEYHSLGLHGTNAYREGVLPEHCPSFIVESACSGVYVSTPDTWATHYGQDIRFRGWGYEDSAWECAHATLIGPIRRITGNVYSFHHPSQRKEGKQFTLNAALCYRYLEARSDPEQMKALCQEQHIGHVAVKGKVVEQHG